MLPDPRLLIMFDNPSLAASPKPTEVEGNAQNGRPDRMLQPPRSPAIASLGRHKLAVAIIALVCALGGLALGVRRSPTYTASATLQVGQVNPNSPGFYGYVQSAASLATAFSRAITAEPVLATIHDKLNIPDAQAAGRLSAEPIPEAPAFRVIAIGPSEHAAVGLANVAANAVIAYEGQSNNANPEAESLLTEYRHASLWLQHTVEDVARLNRLNHKHMASKTAVANAEAIRNAASARFRAIDSAYTAAVASQAPRTGLVSLLAGAVTASSDKSSKVQLFALLGLLAGLVLGGGAAMLREQQRMRRAARISVATDKSEVH